MDFDTARIRSRFPALARGVAYFDGPGGSQVPAEVAQAVADTMCAGIANRGTVTAAEQRAEATVVEARQAVADLLGCSPAGVVFGRSATQLTFDMARALAKQWAPGDEVIVTGLDHDANIRPWVHAAHAAGATVRWAEPDSDTGDLPVEAVTALLSRRTRAVAVTAASNLLGTRPDIAGIAHAAHEVGALVHVDGVHLTPHAPVDVEALGADIYVCSPYKFFGPHLGVSVAAPALLENVFPDKLLPSTDAVPERFELGTLPYELLAGTRAAVDVIADLVPTDGDRRTRVLTSMNAVEEHEDRLLGRLLDGLAGLNGVTLHGSPAHRTPLALFSVAGRSPQEVHERLAEQGINAPAGSFYALEASRWMGLGNTGAVRAGLAPYTDDEDVDRLLTGVAKLCP
ncbi:cysteine desulfurase-like protein [Haloactinomyces albus]|uniref:Cysteine desulfurase family protein (TIGR01976 family) n=1 Tax=Haloactinomyces albus TaxID=1352928 RepID=A0AAE3ZJZ1_9ACTN|nr:cysteine desulfurase-like protein [Haloactinomyces albus]MDR7304259.1 cysteine desulfurase family protein (TIGR01976 family) [Haloactinomyces albus]